MKIAYCFSGYLRRFWDNSSLQTNIIRRAPGDLFVHTWDTLNYAGPTWHGDVGLASTRIDARILQKLAEQYGPFAKLVVERAPEFPAHLMPTIQGRYSCWRANQFKCEHEMQQGFCYDIVVNLRFDLVVHEPFDFPKAIERGALYCLENNNCIAQGLCCDILNFGCSRTMDIVNELYEAIVTQATALSGERFLTQWCAQRQIPFRAVATRCSLLRSNGSLMAIPGLVR